MTHAITRAFLGYQKLVIAGSKFNVPETSSQFVIRVNVVCSWHLCFQSPPFHFDGFTV